MTVTREGRGKAGAPGLIRRELDGWSSPGTGGEAAFAAEWTVSQNKNNPRKSQKSSSGFRFICLKMSPSLQGRIIPIS